MSLRVKNNHADIQPDDILSELKIAIYGEEAVKACCREPQESAVLQPRPVAFIGGRHFLVNQRLPQRNWSALVEKYAHDEDGQRRGEPSLRNGDFQAPNVLSGRFPCATRCVLADVLA